MPDLIAHPVESPLEVAPRPLEDLETQLEQLKESLVEEMNRAGDLEVDGEFVKRFRETAHRLGRLVNDSLPVSFPPEAGDEIRRTLIDAITEAQEVEEARPRDAVDGLLIRLEQVRHVLRDAVDETLGVQEDNGKALVERLTSWLGGMRQKEIADLVGTSPRTLQRLLRQGGAPSNRIRLVARLVVILRRAWTPEGVRAWFWRPRPELDGQAPIAVLDDAEFEERLMLAARQGRAGHGS